MFASLDAYKQTNTKEKRRSDYTTYTTGEPLLHGILILYIICVFLSSIVLFLTASLSFFFLLFFFFFFVFLLFFGCCCSPRTPPRQITPSLLNMCTVGYFPL